MLLNTAGQSYVHPRTRLANVLETHLREDVRETTEEVEIQRVTATTIQVKLRNGDRAPRYFNVKVSEMM